MIQKRIIRDVGYEIIKKATYTIPQELISAIKYATDTEAGIAKRHLETLIANHNEATKNHISVCGDTGFNAFFIRLGNVEIENGVCGMEESLKEAIKKLVDDGVLRSSTVNPVTHQNTGINMGPYLPYFDYIFDPTVDYVEIIASLAGAGTEVFATRFRSLLTADGILGVKKFVIDSVVEASKFGASCPPNIVGVGIGGTASTAMKIAKRAAILRPVDARHPDTAIAKLEAELVDALNKTGIGSMGMGGNITVFDIHIECAPAHIAGFPLAVSSQCPAARLAVIRIKADGTVEHLDQPEWRKWFTWKWTHE